MLEHGPRGSGQWRGGAARTTLAGVAPSTGQLFGKVRWWISSSASNIGDLRQSTDERHGTASVIVRTGVSPCALDEAGAGCVCRWRDHHRWYGFGKRPEFYDKPGPHEHPLRARRMTAAHVVPGQVRCRSSVPSPEPRSKVRDVPVTFRPHATPRTGPVQKRVCAGDGTRDRRTAFEVQGGAPRRTARVDVSHPEPRLRPRLTRSRHNSQNATPGGRGHVEARSTPRDASGSPRAARRSWPSEAPAGGPRSPRRRTGSAGFRFRGLGIQARSRVCSFRCRRHCDDRASRAARNQIQFPTGATASSPGRTGWRRPPPWADPGRLGGRGRGRRKDGARKGWLYIKGGCAPEEDRHQRLVWVVYVLMMAHVGEVAEHHPAAAV